MLVTKTLVCKDSAYFLNQNHFSCAFLLLWAICAGILLLFVGKEDSTTYGIKFTYKRVIYMIHGTTIRNISIYNRRRRTLHNFQKLLFTSTDLASNFGRNIFNFVAFFLFENFHYHLSVILCATSVEPWHNNHLN